MIIFLISLFLPYVVTPNLNRLVKTVQVRGTTYGFTHARMHVHKTVDVPLSLSRSEQDNNRVGCHLLSQLEHRIQQFFVSPITESWFLYSLKYSFLFHLFILCLLLSHTPYFDKFLQRIAINMIGMSNKFTCI